MDYDLSKAEQEVFSMVLMAKQLHSIEGLVGSVFIKTFQLGIRDDNLERQQANLKDIARGYDSKAMERAEELGVDYKHIRELVYRLHTRI